MLHPTNLNKPGMDHVRDRLKEIGLNWDVNATATEIESTNGFAEILTIGYYEYEITNHDMKNAGIGSGGYGVAHTIEILPEHCDIEDIDLGD